MTWMPKHFALCIFSLAASIAAHAQEVEDLQGRATEELKALRNADGSIDLAAMQQSAAARQQMIANRGSTPRATLDAASLTWQEIGPDNIGGRVRSIAVDPSNANRIFAGSAGGGIWRSTDAGQHWAQAAELANLAITHIVIAPTDPNTMFAATGELVAYDGLPGAGIFKSTDGGTTWNVLPSTVPASYGAPFSYTMRLWINPNSKNILIAATGGILYNSNDGGTTWTPNASHDLQGYPDICDIVSNPSNPAQILAGGCNSGIFRSADGGSTWVYLATSPNSRSTFAWSKSQPSIVYAANDANGQGGSLYVSTDYGLTFTQKNSNIGTFPYDQSSYDNCIWVDPNNANNIVVGGVWLYRSVDGGTTFQYAGFGTHSDYHSIVAQANYNGTTNPVVYVSSDGGVWSNNQFFTGNFGPSSGPGWTNLSNGLRITQFYEISANNAHVAGGTQDNGTPIWTAANAGPTGMNWTLFTGADGGYAPLSSQPTYVDYAFSEIQYLGGPYEKLPADYQEHYIGAGLTEANNGAFVAPFLLDDAATPRLIAGAQHLWQRSNPFDLNASWQPIAATTPQANNSFGGTIAIIAIAPTNRDVMWVYAGGLLASNNATSATPSFAYVTLPFGTYDLLSVHISRFNQNVAYVTTSGFAAATGHVLKTSNGGASWTNITGNLPIQPVWDLAESPWDANTLYVATYNGVYASGDSGSTWTPLNGGPSAAAVRALTWRNNQLVAATHGRGAFLATLPNDLSINMTHSGNFAQGQTGATFTIAVSNVGANASNGPVTVSFDALPAGLSFMSLSKATNSSLWDCSSGTSCVRSDALAAGQSYDALTLTVSVASNAVPLLTATARVSGGGDTAPNNNGGPDTVQVTQLPDVQLLGQADTAFVQGQSSSYTFTVKNIGYAATTATLTLSDPLPVGLTPGTPIQGSGCTVNGQVVTCTHSASLGINQSYTVTIPVVVSGTAPSSVSHTATVTGGSDSYTNNNSLLLNTPIAGAPHLSVTSTDNGFYQGETYGSAGGAKYTLMVHNGGTVPTSGTVTVSEALSSSLTFAVVSGSGWSCTTNPISCRSSTVISAGGNSSPITIGVSVPWNAPTSVTNSITVQGGSDPAITTTNPQTTIAQEPHPQITSSHTGPFVQDQTNAVFTLQVTNNGFAATSGMVIASATPTYGAIVTSMSGSGWTCPTSTNYCSRNDALNVGASYPNITVTTFITPDAPTTVTNVVQAVDQISSSISESTTATDPATVNAMTLGSTPDLAAWIDNGLAPRVENVSTPASFSNVRLSVSLAFQTEGLVFTPPSGCSWVSSGSIGSQATYTCSAGTLSPTQALSFPFQCNNPNGSPVSGATPTMGTISVSLVTPTTPADGNAGNNGARATMPCATESF